jgi:general secretion pathway protein A
MYTHFYGFAEKPFNVTPDPKFLYLTASHREALASMMYGITERRGYIAITGEVGTGKTTLIYTLLNQLSEKVRAVCVFHPAVTFEQLLRTILSQLGIPGNGGKDELLRAFETYLRAQLAGDKIVALIIDEAQDIPVEVLEEIRLLSNLETEKEKLLQIVFVGQPEFEKKLDSEHLRQLKQRIVMRRIIPPLTRNEIIAYIEQRLMLVGSSTADVFTAEALALICTSSRGVPRTINIICDNALLLGYGLSRKQIDDKIILEALRDMAITGKKQPADQIPVVAPAAYPPSAGPAYATYKKFAAGIFLLCIVGLLVFLAKEFSREKSVKPDAPMTGEAVQRQRAAPAPGQAQPETSPAVESPVPNIDKKDAAETLPPAADSKTDTKTTAPAAADVIKETPETSAPSAPEENPAQPPSEQPTEGKTYPAATATPAPPVANASASTVSFKQDIKIKQTATVQKGDTIYSLARKYYQSDNRTIIDLILQANPGIRNSSIIKTAERVKIPEIDESSLILKSADNDYAIHLATYANPAAAGTYQNEPLLKHYRIEVIRFAVAPHGVFYRIVAGPFKSRHDCLNMILQLKIKKLLPALTPSFAKS